MKTLLDRMADAIHCQLFAGKYSVTVATSGSLGHDQHVLEYMNEVMLTLCSYVTGNAGASMAAGPEALADAASGPSSLEKADGRYKNEEKLL